MRSPLMPSGLIGKPNIDGWLQFNPDETISVRTGKVELGQGITTALAQIVAEELDVSPVRIRMCRATTEGPNEGFTAGSLSIEYGGHTLRRVASAARAAFLQTIAAQLRCASKDLTVRDGEFFRDGKAIDRTYWTVSEDVDLRRPVDGLADPKIPEEYRVVGRSVHLLDLHEKLGGAAFIHDVELPGMLHGRVVHPPTLDSRLASLDAGRSEEITRAAQLVRNGAFIGVIAKSEAQAVKLATTLAAAVSWDFPKPSIGQSFEQAIHTSHIPSVRSFEAGSPPGGVTRRFEATYRRPFLAHASIGTACAIAQWEGNRLKVWSQSQGIFALRWSLATALGLELEDVEVLHVPGAGCYGHNGADDVALDAALLAKEAAGSPVRVQWSRADELAVSPLGSAMCTSITAATDENGRLVDFALTVRSAPHSARPGWSGGINLLAARHVIPPSPTPVLMDPELSTGGGADRNAVPLYEIPHVQVDKIILDSLPIRTSALRSLGGFLNVFAIESMIDDIAASHDTDAAQFRLKHLSDSRARRVIQEVASMAPWPGPAGDGQGLGLAFARYKNRAAYCAIIVEVNVDEEVRISRVWAAVDAGLAINPDGVRNQIEGGIIQSASWTLRERVLFEGHAVSSKTWEDYPIMRFSEIPAIEVRILEDPNLDPVGAGEAAQGPMAGAIGNAIKRALGVRVFDMPITRDRIIGALA
jgi:nicotinate dehydrogenase subunit B